VSAQGGAPDRLARRVARNSAVGLGAQGALKLLSLAFSVLVVRQLGAATYGQYAAVLAYGAVFVIFADLGLSVDAVRHVALARAEPAGDGRIADLYANLLGLRLILSLGTAALIVGSAWLTGRPPLFLGALALGAIGLVLYSAQGAASALLAGYERLDLAAGAQVVYQLTFVVVGAGALLLHTGYYGLIVANLLGIGAITGMCLSATRRLGVRPGRLTPTAWPALLRASLPFAVIGFTLGLSYKFDSVVLNIFRGDAETGYYNAAYNLVFSAVVLSNVVNSALYPSLTRQAAADPSALPRIYERALGYLMLLALPITFGTWAVAERLVPMLFSAAYGPTVAALRIVIWVTPLMYASEFLGYVVVVRGEEGRVARAILASTGVNVAVNLVVVPRFGLLGAAALTVATEVLLVGQYLWLLRALVRQMNGARVLGRPLLAAALMAVVLLALRQAPLSVQLATGALVYAALVVVLGVVGDAEIRFLAPLVPALPVLPALPFLPRGGKGGDRAPVGGARVPAAPSGGDGGAGDA
jgi:O-antigen/teichoic acid export membrane protein